MRNIYSLTLLLCLLCAWQPGRCQQFIWAKQATTGFQQGSVGDPVLEEGGNSYWGGNFRDSANFDGTKLHTSNTYTSKQLFVTKLNSAGKVMWVRSNTGTGFTDLYGICGDNAAHIYLYGAFEGVVNFGSLSITGDIGIFSYFIAKCDSAGNFLWVKSYNNSASKPGPDIRLKALTCDRLGNIYIQGNADGTFNANGISYSFTSAWERSSFVAQLSPATGNAVWTRFANGDAYQWPGKIATDYNNNLIVSGVFGWAPSASPGKFVVFNGTDTLRTTTNNNIWCTYLAKYNTNGVYQWAKQIGTKGYNDIWSMTCDSAGNTYMLHDIGDTVTAGVYQSRPYMSKRDPGGSPVWSIPMWTSMSADNIAANRSGVYIAGTAGDTMTYQGHQYFQKGEHNMILKIDPATAAPIWLASPESRSHGGYMAVSNRALLFTGNTPFSSRFGANLLYNGDKEYAFAALLNDTSVASGNNKISGSIYSDINGDCSNNAGDAGQKGFSVLALPGPFYGTADTAGNYEMSVPPGTYTVQQVTPYNHGMVDTQSCPPASYSVALPGSNQVSPGNDFGNSYHACPLLKVTTKGNAFLCKKTLPRDFTIRNYGLDTARAITLKVRYPGTVFSPVWSSVPWTSYNPLDSTLTFDLGDLAPDSTLTITVKDTAVCNNFTGFYFPFRATLTPLNTCYGADTGYNYARFYDRPNIPIGVPILQQPERSVEVFPNPSTGVVNITGLEAGDLLQVYSAFGERISEERIGTGNSGLINLSRHPTGVYFISVRGKGISLVKKVMKL